MTCICRTCGWGVRAPGFEIKTRHYFMSLCFIPTSFIHSFLSYHRKHIQVKVNIHSILLFMTEQGRGSWGVFHGKITLTIFSCSMNNFIIQGVSEWLTPSKNNMTYFGHDIIVNCHIVWSFNLNIHSVALTIFKFWNRTFLTEIYNMW